MAVIKERHLRILAYKELSWRPEDIADEMGVSLIEVLETVKGKNRLMNLPQTYQKFMLAPLREPISTHKDIRP